MTKRPDMQEVGARIAHLRREKGLCAAAFARELEQPVWLIMLLESAHMEQSKRLIDLLPDSVIEALLREIREVFDVSNRWLTTRYQSPKHPPLQAAEPLPEPLFLPIAITPEDALSVFDSLMELALPNSSFLLQYESLFRTSMKTVSMLYQLHVAHLAQSGNHALAAHHRQQFKQLLDQRATYWKKELHITDESTSA